MSEYRALIFVFSRKDAMNDKFRKNSPSGRYVFIVLHKTKIRRNTRTSSESEKENKNNDCTQTALLCNFFYDPRLRYNIENLLEVAEEALKNQFNFIVALTADVIFRG